LYQSPVKKQTKENLISFATQTLVALHTFFATLELQHQIDAPWQMSAFRISNNNGIIETSYF
jgi:hypothetical protein